MPKDLSIINREAILIMIEEAAHEAAAKAVKLYAAANPPAANSSAAKEDEDRLLTKKEAAGYLRISINALDIWRKDGTVKTTMVGGTRPRFKMSDLKATLQGDNVTT
jgi:hypothetical protein